MIRASRRSVAIAALAVLASLASAGTVFAQADVIRGRITSATTNAPLEGATVIATPLSGGPARPARTDGGGRFTIIVPGSEGDYFITVRAIGYVPRRFEIKRTAEQDILIADARLTEASSTLDTVVTVGRRDRPVRTDTLRDVSGTERVVTTSNLPIEQLGSLAAMAASTPGLLFIPGTDGDPSGYSVLGLDQGQNAMMLDGMRSNGGDLPRDGAYAVSVALSPYDIAQGQFSGAQLNVRVGSGSNYVVRSSSLLLNAPSLQWTDAAGRSLGQRYTNLNLGGGTSGPLALDKAFYNLSYQLGRRANPLQTLLNTDALGLQTAGIARDSIARLVDVLETVQAPPTVGGFPSSRLSDQGLVLASIDVAPPSSTSGQAFRFTASGGWNKSSPATALTNTFPGAAFNNTSWDSAIQGRHTNYYGIGILSETGVALSRSRRFTTPYLELPTGNVLVGSDFADGTSGIQSIVFGGTATHSASTNSMFEVTNQLSWFSQNNKHRLKLTSDVRGEDASVDQTNNQTGTFSFASIADLQSNRATSFTRQLTPHRLSSRQLVGSVALGDSYRPGPDLQIVYGVRLDANRFLDRPAVNPDVARLFGAPNDAVPDGLYLSERLGFAWTYGESPMIAAFANAAPVPRAVVRGGIGVFQGIPNTTLPGQAMFSTGLPNSSRQLTCTGVATPVPDWGAYAADPASLPDHCADGTDGTVFASTAPNVALFARDFAAPRSIRSNLQWAGPLLDNRVMTTVNGTVSINQRQPGFADLNFDPTRRFTLSDEDGRPVFVQPTSIAPGTGAVASRDGRVAPQFNRVTELHSRLSSLTRQFQILLAPVGISTRYTWSLSYVNNSVRDRASGFTSTAASPFDFTSSRSSLDWRHQIQFNVGYNFFDVVRLNWFESVFSGMPFTPLTVGDVNGDGYAGNDRAFVFDPAHSVDASVATAMERLLAESSSGVRSCLRSQLGHIAKRNSCETPWSTTASLRIELNPVRVRMPRRTTLSLSIANPLAGADLLFHGASNLHGWGQVTSPDNRLLFVRGFDPASRRYIYQVNPRFGNSSQANNAVRNPVAVTALVRVDLGPTRERQDLTRRLDRGRRTSGPRITVEELGAAYGSAGLLNPMSVVLRASDSQHLTGRQADSLAAMNRWYLVRLDSIWTPVIDAFGALPERYGQVEAYTRYRRAREASVDLLIKLAPAIKSLLTPAQFRNLPALTAAYLDLRYLAAVRSGTPGLSNPVFPPPAGTPGQLGGGRGGRP